MSRLRELNREDAARRRRESGMTLVEILVVVTILGIIGTVLAVNVFEAFNSSKPKLARTGIEQLVNAVNIYKMDHGKLPESLDELLHPPQESGSAKSYINSRDNLIDPWKHPYAYDLVENGGVRITSFGSDGQAGGTGEAADISNVDEDEGGH
jgi:general secretion pathway protein G